MLLLICILFNIMILNGNKYANMAANQRINFKEQGRHTICDKNMIPFTSGTPRYKVSYASHIIGYTDKDGVGICGMEKLFNDELTQNTPVKATLKDGSGKSIPIFKTNESGNEKEQYVKLTLDYHIQKITENVLNNHKIKGAAVVMDVNSFDILSIASRPQFDRNNVEIYTKYGDTELLNRALSPYNAGSIFKIITTAAALEDGTINENSKFFCGGSMIFDNILFPCHKTEGHGYITLKDAMSLSCNCAFYNIANLLGSEKICEYGEKFGIGKCVLANVFEENNGNIPKELSHSKSEASNLAIGQGEIMITPIQAAKIACIIAAGGISKEVNIADSIVGKDGSIIKNLRKENEERIISAENAGKIGEMMLSAVESGTGFNAKSDKVSIAGKTGSAETGWQKDDGFMVQGWFIGFFPYENPRYAIAVMAEDGRQGNKACAPIFKEIAEQITDIKKAR